jgi:hypothetical protein
MLPQLATLGILSKYLLANNVYVYWGFAALKIGKGLF